MKNSLYSKALLLVFFVFGFFAVFSESDAQTADQIKVTGKVADKDGKPIVGAVIMIKGTTSGTATNEAGFFSLLVPSAESVLVVSFIDFESKEIKLGKDTDLKIVLNAESNPQLLVEGFKIYTKVDEAPLPEEGLEAWNKYMATTIRYPEEARKTGQQGTVVVGFEIDQDGFIQNVEVLRGIGRACDEEVVRVIAQGPKWKPGKSENEKVITQMSLPVRFVISKGPGEPSFPNENEKAIAQAYGKHVLVVGYSPADSQK